MSSRLGACLVIVLLLSGNSWADESLKDTLVAHESKLIDAIGRQESATIAKLLADETYSITASRGRRSTDEVIQDLEKLRFASYKISDAVAIPVTDDVAILTYTFTYTVDASSPATTVYATSIWKKSGSEWDSIFYQETPITN